MEETEAESNIGIGFTSKGEIPKEELVTEAWRTCIRNRGQEMRRGYFNKKIDARGDVQKIWIPDTRELYINSVIALDILLTADYSEEYKKARKLILEKARNSFKKWGWKSYNIKLVKISDGYKREKYKKVYTGEVVMPEPNQEGINLVYGINADGKRIPFDWSNNHHQYMQSLVYVYDELLSKIADLLKKLKYFKKTVKYG